ncbi:MAG: carbon-nitrogen hydrolase family protein [Planctomycetota bacterium]|jgi:predicted amidohydrolase|nr:carbon-nitrogen hydrolase family protein [Planctomycetota bacterium]
MRIAVCQAGVVFGDVEANLKTTLDALRKAEDAGAQVLCMPETFLQGYFNSEEAAHRNSISLDSAEFKELLGEFGKFSPMLLLGLNELRGDRLFNTMVVADRGQLVGRYSKNYLVYDYFCRGHDFPVFEKDGVKFGIIICADSSYMEPARIEAMRGAQIIFSPHFNYIGHKGVDAHTKTVRSQHVARAVENEVYVIKANVVVPESVGEPFMGYPGVGVGDSFILNRQGIAVAEAGIFTETMLVHDIPEEDLSGAKRRYHSASDEIIRQLFEEYESESFRKHQRKVSKYD